MIATHAFEYQMIQAAASATPAERQSAKTIAEDRQQESVTTVTPTIAAILYADYMGPSQNRQLSMSIAAKLADQMRQSMWQLLRQGLKFSQSYLEDGKHRLAAVFLSGTTQQFWVLRS